MLIFYGFTVLKKEQKLPDIYTYYLMTRKDDNKGIWTSEKGALQAPFIADTHFNKSIT